MVNLIIVAGVSFFVGFAFGMVITSLCAAQKLGEVYAEERGYDENENQ